jgi:trans-aconitate methyltransferase
MNFGDGIDWNAEARRANKEGQPGNHVGELVRRVKEIVIAGPQSRNMKPVLVDCGCNIGRFCPQVQAAELVYIGVDQADEALAIARKRYPGVSFVKSMLWDPWPRSVGPIDAAICNAVLQHNTHDEKRRILARIAEAVPAGGVFAMQESTVVQETKTQLRQGDWIKLVEGFGFKLHSMWHPNDEFGILDGYVFLRVGS